MINRHLEDYYTYDDYKDFDEKFRCEIIDGVIYDMSPAPSTSHQRLLLFLCVKIANYLNDKNCEVFPAPFDVFLLDEDQNISKCKRIVQPDISVICDESKITKKGCIGAPDFIIEIVSPSSRTHDYIRKLNLYSDYKVREYWIVNPENNTIVKYLLGTDAFISPMNYTFEDEVKIEIFDDLYINFKEINI